MIELILVGIATLIFLCGMRIIRPNERAVVERLGRYECYVEPGFKWIIPLVDRLIKVNVTETMIEAKPQQIITKDKLNASVDAQVYFKVKPTEEGVKNSLYNVNDYEWQIVNLSRTTLRNIIGTMTLTSANSERDTINKDLMTVLATETKTWGIEVVRTELKEIDPPQDVQETMNKVVKAENEKVSAVDYATAAETKADGERRARIKEAEGIKQYNILVSEGKKTSQILEAEGQAKAFELINQSFKGQAVELKKLDSFTASFKDNVKYVIDPNSKVTNVISEMSGLIPIQKR